jgi:hypothetical protein
MKKFNIYETDENLGISATVESDNKENALRSFKLNSFPSKKAMEYNYHAKEVISGMEYCSFDKRSKKTVIKRML